MGIMKVLSKIKQRIVKVYNYDSIVFARKRYAQKDLKEKKIKLDLTNEQISDIKSFWNRFHKLSNHELKWFRFYNNLCEDKSKLKYYIPDTIYYSKLDLYFSEARKAYILDDKNMYDLYFHDVAMPNTIARIVNGVMMDKNYNIISTNQMLELCLSNGKVVSKESVMSEGGHGVKFWDLEQNPIDDFRDYIVSKQNIIVQDVINQHSILNSIHKNSINTIRIITLLNGNSADIVSSVLRMGINGSKVDNASSGGIVCGISNSGKLKNKAFDTKGNIYEKHPQGTIFSTITIPNYKKCCEIAIHLANRFVATSKLISWDFSIDENGSPILIEMNMTFGEIDFHQMCNGPLFEEKQLCNILSSIFK